MTSTAGPTATAEPSTSDTVESSSSAESTAVEVPTDPTAFQFRSSASNPGSTSCTPDSAACVVVGAEPVSYEVTGDWVGTLTDATGASGAEGGDGLYQYQAVGVRIFDGTVEGCGEGSVVFASEDENLVALDGSIAEPTRAGRWWVVAGTGTGDLARMTGGGEVALTVLNDESGLGASIAHSGWVDCSGQSPSPTPEAGAGDELVAVASFPLSAQTSSTSVCTAGTTRCTSTALTSWDDVSGPWNGAIRTTAANVSLGDGADARLIHHSVTVFSGAIEGCGAGSLRVRHYAEFDLDPAALVSGGQLIATDAWEIIPGYGTGALANASGSGHSSATLDGETFTMTFLGTFHCGPLGTGLTAKATETGCPTEVVGVSCAFVSVPVDYYEPDGAHLDLFVTISRTDPTAWHLPVLRSGLLRAAFDWSAPPPPTPGIDGVWVDHRGAGRSAPLQACAGFADVRTRVNTGQIDDDTARVVQDCVDAAMRADVPLPTVIDPWTAAADLSMVRRALGIDRWAVAGGTLTVDTFTRLMVEDPDTVTAMFVINPAVAGTANSNERSLEVFRSFAADCAASSSCSTSGDLEVAFGDAIERYSLGVTTGVSDTSGPIVLDAAAIANGVDVAIADPDIAAALPALLAGAVSGSTDDTIASYYLDRRYSSEDAWTLAMDCQTFSFGRPAKWQWAGDETSNPFAARSWQDLCAATGPVPQVPIARPVMSDIPVLAVVSEYSTISSVGHAQRIFAGFPNTTIVEVPGIVDPTKQIGDCVGSVFADFIVDPAGDVDVSCLEAPATSTVR